LLTLRYPAVLWGSLTYGVTLGWVVLQQTANAGAFPELYGFSGLGVGNINAAVSILRNCPAFSLTNERILSVPWLDAWLVAH